MMLSDRHPILLANARIVDPSRDLDIVGDLLIAEGVIREAKKGIGAAGVPEGTDVIDCRGRLSVEHFDLPYNGWDLEDPVQWACDLAARLRAS